MNAPKTGWPRLMPALACACLLLVAVAGCQGNRGHVRDDQRRGPQWPWQKEDPNQTAAQPEEQGDSWWDRLGRRPASEPATTDPFLPPPPGQLGSRDQARSDAAVPPGGATLGMPQGADHNLGYAGPRPNLPAIAAPQAEEPRAAIPQPQSRPPVTATDIALTAGGPAAADRPVAASTPAPAPRLEDFTPDVLAIRQPLRDRADYRQVLVQFTGQPSGNLASIDQTHRLAGLPACGYHFVIGNGRGARDGEIETTLRWLYQEPGVLLAAGPPYAQDRTVIVIGLVGAAGSSPSPAQLAAIRTLFRHLAQVYGLSDDRLRLE